MNWKRVSADRIRSGDYVVSKEKLWNELVYLAEHKRELLSVCYEAAVAKAVCERHLEAQ